MTSWPMQEIARICQADWQGPAASAGPARRFSSAPSIINHFAIDHRQLGDNGVFIALPGNRHDGHDFVPQLSARRGQAAIVSHAVAEADIAQLVVADPLKALHNLARSKADQLPAAKIAITGSVGKTGTKEMLARCLSGFGTTHASPGNFNNHIGAPLSIANTPDAARFVIAEMGMNRAGEIGLLANLFNPHIAVITKIAASHAGFFSRLEDIADAKAEIFSAFAAGGTAILPGDDRFFSRLAGAARMAGADRILSFGESEGCDIRLSQQTRSPLGQKLLVTAGGQQLELELAMQAPHWGVNALAVLAVAAALELDLQAAAQHLSGMADLPGRGARFDLVIEGHYCRVIDDAYNAGPASMQAALADFASLPAKGRVLILSDMLELGSLAESAHAELKTALRQARPDHLLLIGPLMASLAGELADELAGELAGDMNEDGQNTAINTEIYQTAEQACARARELAGQAELMLIKGSNGSGAHLIAADLRRLAGKGGAG